MRFRVVLACTLFACGSSQESGPPKVSEPDGGGMPGPTAPAPILFVTSVPGVGFMHQLNTFANHGTGIADAVPGGDLYLRYADGELRNLTAEAGFGVPSGGIQGGEDAICVRNPSVSWDGKKAVFAMMRGGPTEQFDNPTRYWQLYEVTGLGKGETAVITRVAGQAANRNNFNPIYGTDDQILYVSDAPLYGMDHTYPQLDEYESTPTNTGIWKLGPSGPPRMIEHAPSGAFDLFLDSYGRVLFTKWDHLKRDQQADLTRYEGQTYNPFDFPDESAGAVRTAFPAVDGDGKPLADNRGALYEMFPDPLSMQDPTRAPNEAPLDFNQFFIWQMNEDGSDEETLDHAGRHELGGTYTAGSFTDDPNLDDQLSQFSANEAIRATVGPDSGFFQIHEDPRHPGRYLVVYAKEFRRQAAGRIFEIELPPGANPEDVVVTDLTNATLDDAPFDESPTPPKPTMTGHFRDPTVLGDGTILVAHTPEYRVNADDSNDDLRPDPRYVFQLKRLVPGGPPMGAGVSAPLTGGIVKDVRWFTDAGEVRYDGPLNETDIVEVVARTRPATRQAAIDPIERAVIESVLGAEGISVAELQAWMTERGLALVVSRNVTVRDRGETGQPYNLRVPGGVATTPTGGKVYDVKYLQLVQGDLTRAYEQIEEGRGRRVFSRPIHDSPTHPDVEAANPMPLPGSVELGADGSMAAFVPAGRALSWQLTDPTGKPVVRERVWVSFAPGEIRTCANCHGLNSKGHGGLGVPVQPPAALESLMQYWLQGQAPP
jgi:Hydrazine synthase alpha subunit middle domain